MRIGTSEASLRPTGYARADGAAVARWPRALTMVMASYAIAGGLITLIGWATNLPRLTAWKNDGISMFPNTAVCAIACGVVLLLVNLPGRQWRVVARAASILVLAIGGLTLLEHLTASSCALGR